MHTRDFHFDLPSELIAQAPLPERSASRLLVVPPGNAPYIDAHMRDLPDVLRAGDLLIFNNTRVIPARFYGTKATGGRVEFMLERLTGPSRAIAQIGASKAPKPDSRITLDGGGEVEVLERVEGGFYLLEFLIDGPLTTWLERAGQLPLPPYIERTPDGQDAERYQTVFARHAGAVAAPTAGLHFDEALLAACKMKGVETAQVTLHVGAGTFQPVRAEVLSEHRMHAEWVSVSESTAAQIQATRAAGGRVIAVGTTVLRALESAWLEGAVRAFEGETRIFIHPPMTVKSVDGLVTNFHLPESTLLMLVSAFAGQDRVFGAYRHAVAQRYRFFSYGDAMLLVNQTLTS